MNNKNPIIRVENVAKSFGNLEVHHDISFNVYKGETITILGPSGSGKTVILKMIIGLLRPTSGEVYVMDTALSEASSDRLMQIRSEIGMLFQGAALFDSLTVYDNIAYSLRERDEMSESQISEIVSEKLDIIGMPGYESKFPPQLSGGQKKRVGLARALASSPRVILFDEPTTGLDPTTIRTIDQLIIKLRDEFGITSIVVTHDIESARRVSNRWILINNGLIIADGPVERLVQESQPVIDFISGNWKTNRECRQIT